MSGPGPRAAAVAAAALAVLVWWTASRHLDLRIAWSGWSILDWLNHHRMPENFVRDFSNGIAAYEQSAVLHLYPLTERWLAITPETMLWVLPALEILAVLLASCAVAWSLFGRARPEVACTLFVYLVASSGPDMDLARFGMPYPFGLYYWAAEACRLAAIAFAIRRRYFTSALLIGLAALSHPLMALYAAIFIAAMMAVTPRDFASRGAVLGALSCCAMVLPWLLVRVVFNPDVSLVGTGIPADLWLPLMRAFSVHFFPVDFGLFTTYPEDRVLPLISFLALFAYYLPGVGLGEDTIRRLALAALVMALISALGVALSVGSPSPFTVKFALHRASLVLVLMALPIVAAGLWQDLAGEYALRRIAAAGALLSPFFMDPGWALLFSLVLCRPGWQAVISRRPSPRCDRVSTLLLVLALVLAPVYYSAGFASLVSPVYWGSRATWVAIAAFVLLAYGGARFAGSQAARRLAGYVVMAAGAAIWLTGQALTESQARLFADYKAAQLWARDQTPRTALFMVDPTIFYGWRDFSQRSSFGNLREWLHTSWAYTSDAGAFREGLQRFGEFGIDLAPYLNQRPSVARGSEALTREVRKRYNETDDGWRRSIASRYGIDYFVMVRNDWKSSSDLPVAYANGSFLILRARPGAGDRDRREASPRP